MMIQTAYKYSFFSVIVKPAAFKFGASVLFIYNEFHLAWFLFWIDDCKMGKKMRIILACKLQSDECWNWSDALVTYLHCSCASHSSCYAISLAFSPFVAWFGIVVITNTFMLKLDDWGVKEWGATDMTMSNYPFHIFVHGYSSFELGQWRLRRKILLAWRFLAWCFSSSPGSNARNI
jgi:hypothetical protein